MSCETTISVFLRSSSARSSDATSRDESRIERRRRLVEQHDVRLHRQRAGDRHALLLSARQARRIFVLPAREANEIQVQAADVLGLRPRHLLHRDRRLDHVLERGQVRKQIEVLEDQADPQPHAVDEIVFLRSATARPPTSRVITTSPIRICSLVEPLEPIQAAEHRRLAAARRAENGRELSLRRSETWRDSARMSCRSA